MKKLLFPIIFLSLACLITGSLYAQIDETFDAVQELETESLVPDEPMAREVQLPYLCVSGLMPDGEKPLAVVNEQVVEEGDSVDGARVIKISSSNVSFSYQGDTFAKNIGEGCRASGRAVPPKTPSDTRTTARRSPGGSSPFGQVPSFDGFGDVEAGAVTTLIGVLWIVWIALYVYFALVLNTIATKTSTANGWFAWIPFLNLYLMCQISGRSSWLILLMFIPFANLIVFVMLWMGIAEARGKPGWLGVLMVLPVTNLIIPGYLAFSK
ncbi:DUF5684 domain-containing protein [Candidatus Omnitrophota bacterium]